MAVKVEGEENHVLEMKSDLVSMVIESSRTPNPQHNSNSRGRQAGHVVERGSSWRLSKVRQG